MTALQLLHVGRIPPTAGWAMGMHRHDHFSEFIVVLAGRLEARLPKGTFVAGAGDVLHYPVGVRHAERALGMRPLESIFIAWKGRGGNAAVLPQKIRDPHGRIQTLARWMLEVRSHCTGRREPLLNHLLQAVHHAFGRVEQPEQDALPERIRRHVMANIASPIALDELASAACLSRFHFVRRFRTLTGMTPMSFVRDLRIDAARTLVLTTDLPLRAVAVKVGFSDASQLSRVFAHRTGAAPSMLRRKARP